MNSEVKDRIMGCCDVCTLSLSLSLSSFGDVCLNILLDP